MLTFLRKIRRSLIGSGATRKYLLYAIGEILLVMVGILLALQVNNWNEQRKQNNLEESYLLSLKEEFQENISEANRVIKLNARVLENAKTLANHTGPGTPTINEEEFSKLLFGTINNEVQYRPGSGVINEIINSGKLNIFRDPELKKALASLDGLLLKVRFQEKDELSNVRMRITSIIQNGNISSRRMIFDAYGGQFGMDGGRFHLDNLDLLKSIPFDNYLTQFVYSAGYLEGRYEQLKDELNKVISIIDEQVDERNN